MKPEIIALDVNDCSACCKDHKGIEFIRRNICHFPYENGFPFHNMVGICPTTQVTIYAKKTEGWK